jgi:hypothetical protein
MLTMDLWFYFILLLFVIIIDIQADLNFYLRKALFRKLSDDYWTNIC